MSYPSPEPVPDTSIIVIGCREAGVQPVIDWVLAQTLFCAEGQLTEPVHVAP